MIVQKSYPNLQLGQFQELVMRFCHLSVIRFYDRWMLIILLGMKGSKHGSTTFTAFDFSSFRINGELFKKLFVTLYVSVLYDKVTLTY